MDLYIYGDWGKFILYQIKNGIFTIEKDRRTKKVLRKIKIIFFDDKTAQLSLSFDSFW